MNNNTFYEAALPVNDVKEIKKTAPWVKTATDDINGANADDNIFIDTSNLTNLKFAEYKSKINALYKELSDRPKCILIPVNSWTSLKTGAWNPSVEENPMSMIYSEIKQNSLSRNYPNTTFIFITQDAGYFAVSSNDTKPKDLSKYTALIDKITSTNAGYAVDGSTRNLGDKKSEKDIEPNPTLVQSTPAQDNKQIIDSTKEEINKRIELAADIADSEEGMSELLDNDPEFKKLLAELNDVSKNSVNISPARASRMMALNDKFMQSKVNDQTVEELLSTNEKVKELPTTAIKVDSVNPEVWENLKFINFQKSYNLDADIYAILNSFSKMSYPISIINVEVEDTSNNQDYVDTYTVKCEDSFGKQFTMKFDIPKLINHRFMRLRGNDKVTTAQLLLLPCIKTDDDTVQTVTNYNKVTIERYSVGGKSYAQANMLIKALDKYNGTGIKYTTGNNTKACAKYEVPADYLELAKIFNTIETKDAKIFFNQDQLRANYNINAAKGFPYGVNKKTNEVLYYICNEDMLSDHIRSYLTYIVDFAEVYDTITPARRMAYSRARIMDSKIPIIVLLGLANGFTDTMKRANIKYDMYSKKPANFDKNKQDIIKFKDGMIIYDITYSSSLMMNGLKDCGTEDHSLADLESRALWMDFLECFGDRSLFDALDNFNDLLMDPITVETCHKFGIPDNYSDNLCYASNLLADNKYNKHTDIDGNRYRSTEIIAGYLYKVLAKSYQRYKGAIKANKPATMAVLRSAVIDAILADPMTSDLSILNPLLEVESANSVSFKGLSGMNADRAYTLDKRTYDETMLNKLAMSTGFAANVSITRQSTIDMDIEGTRGYIKSDPDAKDNASVAKTFCMTEALTPFGVTRDDPFRSAMTFIQTSKHSMRTAKSHPLLITNGADEVMPHIVSDTFAFKAKSAGKISEITDSYMLIQYKDGTSDYISLEEEVKKNSDGGFFVVVKLDTDLKVGSTVKQDDIVAYDKLSFSNMAGTGKNLAYHPGILTKVAIMSTDEGFEDSTVITEWASEAMASDVVTSDVIELDAGTNVYHLVTKGQPIQEGEPLIIFQNAFDEEEANRLLKAVTDKDNMLELGQIKKKSHYTGFIQDIKIYRTVELDELSDSLRELVEKYEKAIKKKKALYKKNNIAGANLLDPDFKMPATGKLKKCNGVHIEIFTKYNDQMSVGDKAVAQSAAKGVVHAIIPKDKEPWSEYRPEESINGIYSVGSFNARMITSVIVSGLINKLLIEVDRQAKEELGIPIKYLDEM